MSRGLSRIDGTRAFISVAILASAGICYWFLLPAIQSLIIPNAPGGRNGPWVLRPIVAFRFGAMAVMAAVTVPLLTRPLRRMWAREDAALGTRYDPFHNRPGKRVLLVVQGFLLLAIYASALLFYLFSWEIIGPDGIEQRLPWTTRHHSFQDIVSLETIPDGERSESITQEGPWYRITFKSGRSISWGSDNEGCTRDELSAMATFIADRSGRAWARRRDSRAR
jgi:hypothetical protein